MRISDWSSDVCSSDLLRRRARWPQRQLDTPRAPLTVSQMAAKRARFVAPDQAAEPMIEAGRGRDIDFGPAARPGDRQRGVLDGHVGDFSKDAGQAQGQSLITQGASTGAGC